MTHQLFIVFSPFIVYSVPDAGLGVWRYNGELKNQGPSLPSRKLETHIRGLPMQCMFANLESVKRKGNGVRNHEIGAHVFGVVVVRKDLFEETSLKLNLKK